MPTHVYQYPGCSTCRKALKWLDAHDIEYETTDLVAEPISTAMMKDLQTRSGLPVSRFFNTSGDSYRTGGFKERLKKMNASDSIAALAKDGKLVKRPIVDAGDVVLVGFNEDAYARLLG